MKIGIVSTFSDKGFAEYGKYFVDSCKKFIDPAIEIYLYVDSVELDTPSNFKVLPLELSEPKLTEFKQRNKDRPFKDFKMDAVRFAHKTYATFHAAKNNDVDVLIWLDSDTEIYNNIRQEYLLQFLPSDSFVGYIGRDGASETGFLIFNMRHPSATEFFNRYEWYYDTDAVYTVDECHDAFIFDVVRKELEAAGKIKSYNISPPGVSKGHFNSAFNGFMIHYKGDDKFQRDAKISKAIRRLAK